MFAVRLSRSYHDLLVEVISQIGGRTVCFEVTSYLGTLLLVKKVIPELDVERKDQRHLEVFYTFHTKVSIF